MQASRDSSLWTLLIAVAASRLLMQMAAMPPYAGLDEFYHVARLSFVFQEHRNPTTTERSIPENLARAPGWPRSNSVSDGPADSRSYVVPNYEAQQPSAYYTLVAPLAALAPRTVLNQLRVWRLASVLFALITVLAIASIGERWFGRIGVVGAALIVFVPTWETLVVRAGNDALACALVAVAIAVTVAAPRPRAVIAEALFWAAAIAVKLYTWPVAIVAPLLWWRQRASKLRVAVVTGAAIIAAALTLFALSSRTNNPVGVTAFDRGTSGEAPGLSIAEIVKVTIASAAWTSGQHWDALKPAAIAAYALPVLIAVAMAMRKREALIAFAALIAFGAAQTANVIACIVTKSPQIGGKEGWYWFVLAPVLVPALLTPAVARFRWVPWWIAAWDIVITDCELIPTWLGLTSPSHPTLLFRWGPLHVPTLWVIAFRSVQIGILYLMLRRVPSTIVEEQ
jgi:hypothetical protein